MLFDLPCGQLVIEKNAVRLANMGLVWSVVGVRSDNARMVGHTAYDPVDLPRQLYSDCKRRHGMSMLATKGVGGAIVLTIWVRRPALCCGMPGSNARYIMGFARVDSAMGFLRRGSFEHF